MAGPPSALSAVTQPSRNGETLMAKIRRRDYLKAMAASAVALAYSGRDVFAQGSRRGSRPRSQRKEAEIESFDPLVEYFQTWPGTEVAPDANAPVLVTFHGLLDFYYNSSGSNSGACGVGFPRGGGHHSRILEIFENGIRTPNQPIPINNNAELNLRIVENPSQPLPTKVEFLKNGGPQDFRWFIDMQSRPWYRGVVTKDSPGYGARLFVRQGTFFTTKRTKFLLDQVIKVEVGPVSHFKRTELGQPGEVIGAAINLGRNQHVLLTGNGSDIRLPHDASKKYEIRFSHLCPHTSGGPCHFDHRHFQEVKRNDFHHHRDALDLPGFSAKYTVVLAPGQKTRIDSNDAAPCMGAGYGSGNGPA